MPHMDSWMLTGCQTQTMLLNASICYGLITHRFHFVAWGSLLIDSSLALGIIAHRLILAFVPIAHRLQLDLRDHCSQDPWLQFGLRAHCSQTHFGLWTHCSQSQVWAWSSLITGSIFGLGSIAHILHCRLKPHCSQIQCWA